jgi:oligoendopeptidase F
MTKYQWNLTSLFSDDNDPNIELEKQSLQKVATEFVEKWEGRNDWLENAESLRQILEDYNDWLTNWGVYGKVGYYFFLRTSLDSQSPSLKAAQNQIEELSVKIGNQMQFVELRLASVGKNKQAEFLKEEKLMKFRHFLERIFASSEHLLSEDQEKIISLFSFHKGKWVDMVEEFLSSQTVEWQEKLPENVSQK